ncbi:MAG TPA: lysophospholipid acyltransferase family protein [Anaerolineales bacterium]|nr:lysophospholipid acyltransferase family protein [Anaerolineales bacterium]
MSLLTDSPKPSTPDQRDSKRYYFYATPFRKILTPMLQAVFWVFMDLRVKGVENLPSRGPIILAANHLTEFDMFPMQFAIPRPIFFMGKEELFRNPLLDLIIRNLGAFPVQRGARDEWALQHALRVLEHGQVMGIYPEGKRSRGHGLLPAKTGAARLAIAAGCPVVLMAVDGTQHLLKGRPRRTRVDITLSRPMFPHPGEPALDFTDRLMFALAELLPPQLRGVYAVHPKDF